MEHIVVAFSGPIGGGKTTVSKHVASSLGYLWVSFGEYIRKVATARGYSLTRETLQDLGTELITKGWLVFCGAVLSEIAWQSAPGIVVDGVRHVEAIEALRDLIHPSSFLLVYVTLPEPIRLQRVHQRDSLSTEEFERAEEHPVESQITGALPSLADLCVDNTRSDEEVTQEVIAWINSKTGRTQS